MQLHEDGVGASAAAGGQNRQKAQAHARGALPTRHAPDLLVRVQVLLVKDLDLLLVLRQPVGADRDAVRVRVPALLLDARELLVRVEAASEKGRGRSCVG
jgi:hypothetical protein